MIQDEKEDRYHGGQAQPAFPDDSAERGADEKQDQAGKRKSELAVPDYLVLDQVFFAGLQGFYMIFQGFFDIPRSGKSSRSDPGFLVGGKSGQDAFIHRGIRDRTGLPGAVDQGIGLIIDFELFGQAFAPPV